MAVEEGLLPEALLSIQTQPNGMKMMTPQLQSVLYPNDPLDQHKSLEQFTTGAPGTTSRESTLQSLSTLKKLPYPATISSPFSASPKPEPQQQLQTGLTPTGPVSELLGSLVAHNGYQNAQLMNATKNVGSYGQAISQSMPMHNTPEVHQDFATNPQVSEFLTSLATGPSSFNNKMQSDKPRNDYNRGGHSNRVKFSDQGNDHGSNNQRGYSGMKHDNGNPRNHGQNGGYYNNSGNYNNNNGGNYNNNNSGNYNNGGNYNNRGNYNNNNNRGNYNNSGGNRGYGNLENYSQEETGFDRRNNGYGAGRRDNASGGWDRNNRDRDGGSNNTRDPRNHRDRGGPYSRPNRSGGGYDRDSQYGGRQNRGFRDREG